MNGLDPSHDENIVETQCPDMVPEVQIIGSSANDVGGSTSRGGLQKKIARRAKKFSHAEDILICSIFLNVSMDPIVGTNQSSGGYWKRFVEYFDKYKAEGTNRTQVALQHRWKTIQKDMNKYCGYYSEIEHRRESGKTEEDWQRDALQMLEELMGHYFQFMHCWSALRHERKCCDRLVAGNLVGKTIIEESSGQSAGGSHPINVDSRDTFAEHTPRPEGRDTAKKRRAKNLASKSSSIAYVEVLRRMMENREIAEARLAEEHKEYIACKQEQLAIEKMNAQTNIKNVANAERELELREMQEFTRIMAIDVSTIPKWQREYYINLQRKIIEKSRNR